MAKRIIYYHNDLDWICSAAIVNYKLNDLNAEFVSIQYGDKIKEEDIAWKEVYMLDYSDEIEMIFNKSESFVWIDHHKTAAEKYAEYWNNPEIEGIRELDKAWCLLCWEHFFPKTDCPSAVMHVHDRDIWQFKLPYTKEFHEAISMEVDDPTSPVWKVLFGDGWCKLVSNMIDKGIGLLKYKEIQIQSIFNRSMLHGRDQSVAVVNTPIFISDTGAKLLGSWDQVNVAIMFSYLSLDNVLINLRSKWDFDVSLVAKERGGGWHKNAAGCTVNVGNLQDVIADCIKLSNKKFSS